MSERKVFWLVDSSDPAAVTAVVKLSEAKTHNQVVLLTGVEFAAWCAGKIQRTVIEE